MPVSLSNSKDIVANSISVVKGNRIIDVINTIDDVTGIAPSTLNSLEKLANALNNDSNFFQTVSGAISDKADVATTYNKTEVDTALSLKADQVTTYNKTDIDTALNLKANQSSLDSTNATVALKANEATTYTKTEVDTALALKANQTSVADALAMPLTP